LDVPTTPVPAHFDALSVLRRRRRPALRRALEQPGAGRGLLRRHPVSGGSLASGGNLRSPQPYAMGTSEQKGLIMALPTGRPIDRMSLAQPVREIECAVHVRVTGQ